MPGNSEKSWYERKHDEEFDDPLAIPIGLAKEQIPDHLRDTPIMPAEGWPDAFKSDVIRRILSYLPND